MTVTIGLVGNPNCGKTTVFNALTGAKQKVANWSGVTVERKSGYFQHHQVTVAVTDLPGTYSLVAASESASIDEHIACEFILNREADIVINILDASNLERNLYLTTQLIEMQVPVIIAINMMDVARQRGIHIQLEKLANQLGCPVIALEAHKGKGIKALKQAILTANPLKISCHLPYPSVIEQAIQTIANKVDAERATFLEPRWVAVRLLEDDVFARRFVSEKQLTHVATMQQSIRTELNEDPDILLADARYRFIQTLMQSTVDKTRAGSTWTSRLDHIVLNRWLGIPIFLVVMYCMFFFAINIGGAFQDFFDISSDTLFVDGFAHLLGYLGGAERFNRFFSQWHRQRN